MADVATPLTFSSPDPVDVIDAVDLVDDDDNNNNGGPGGVGGKELDKNNAATVAIPLQPASSSSLKDNDGDLKEQDFLDFHAFKRAETLEPETVEVAQRLAQEAMEVPPSSPEKQQQQPLNEEGSSSKSNHATAVTASISRLSLSSVTNNVEPGEEGGTGTTTTTTIPAATTKAAGEEEKDKSSRGRHDSSHTLVDDNGMPIMEQLPQSSVEQPNSQQQQQNDPKKRFVTPKDFDLLKVIGIGAFGKVLQVRNKTSGQVVAMKVISKRLLRRKAGYIENVQAERNILTRVSHYPFVVTMHCSFQTREKLFLIMDFLAGGELFLRLGREGIFLEKDAAFYLGEIILGVDHLHTKGVLHRDLKPENILLSDHGHVCLTDFGLAKDFGENWTTTDEETDEEGRARTICGTQEYMSPEMLYGKGYGRSSDYWSLGCIAYEMLKGVPPFSSKEGSKALFQKIMKEKVKMPPGSSAAACKLLKGLLNRNVQARLGTARSTMFEVGGVAGLKAASFFDKINWEQLERQELVPPYKLTVDNFQDLRNFHDEFVQMSLPRSVMDIATSSALPRRCDSEAFRGFSFIMEDFQLPDRNDDDVEQYWNAQAEPDGESVSDAASSKCDFNNNNAAAAGGAETGPTEAETKKRPPRKRKKKNKVGATTESAATASLASHSPAPSEAGDPPPVVATSAAASVPAATTTTRAIPPASASKLVHPSPTTSIVSAQPTATKTVPAVVPKTPAPKPQPQPKKEVWQSASTTKGKKAPAATATPPRTLGPVVKSTVPQNGWAQPQQRPQKTPPSSRVGGWGTPAAATTAAPTPPRLGAPPGSWAHRIQKSTPPPKSAAKTPSSTRVEPPQTPPTGTMLRSERWLTSQPPPPPPSSNPRQISTSSIGSFASNGEPPSPSSDWRHHSSPQVQRALLRSSTYGSMDSNSTPSIQSSVHGSASPKWPSLGDFPPPAATVGKGLGMRPSAGPAASTAAAMKKPALKGAWASRPKS